MTTKMAEYLLYMIDPFGITRKQKWLIFHRRAGVWMWLTWYWKWLNFCYAWQSLLGITWKLKWLIFHRRAGVWMWLTWYRKWLNFRYAWQSLLGITWKWKWLNFHKRAGVWNFGSDWQDNKNIEFTLYRNFGRDWHDTENRLTLRCTGQKIYRYTWQNLFSSFGDAWNRRKLICLKRWKICTWLAKYLKRRIFL